MFGLYYAIIGLISGLICSFIANKKFRNQKDWFTLGQVLPLLSIVVLSVLPARNEIEPYENYFKHIVDGEKVVKRLS